MFKGFRVLWLVVLMLCSACLSAKAEDAVLARIPGLPPIKESSSFVKLQRRTLNSRSIIMYLIDRFEYSGADIIYNGFSFDSVFSAKIARWFLSRYYGGQTPEEWILKWCNRSVPGNQLIKVKTADGVEYLGRDVLMQELNDLYDVLASPEALEPETAADIIVPEESSTVVSEELIA